MSVRSLIYIFFIVFSLKGYSQCTLDVSISQSEPTICSGNSVTLTATPIAGTAPFTYLWSTGETGSSINVNKAGTYSVTVSDKTAGCQPVKKSLTIATSITPDAPTAKSATVCANTSATLTATTPGGNYQWYDANGVFLANGATYTTPVLTSATTFYVQTTVGGCTSTRTPVGVYITGKPTVTGATVCAGNVATLFADGGDSYTWYDAPSGGTVVSTSASFTTPILNATTTYYVVVVSSNGCVSSPTPVRATVTQAPKPPAVTNQTICQGSTANLHADAPGGIFNWYNVPVGGIPLISSPDYTTPSLSTTTTYYVENAVNDCVSKRSAVTITVAPNPQAPTSQTYSVCYNESIQLTLPNIGNLTSNWYDSAGNFLATGQSYTTPALTSSKTYYVQLINGNCSSTRTPINVIVKSPLSAPSATSVIVCSGGIATLTATSTGGTYQWFDKATNGTLLSSTNTFTTPALTSNTTYYVQRTMNGCVSAMSPVTVSVLAPPVAPVASSTDICYGSFAILSASTPNNNYAWYDAATGGTLLSNAQTFVTPTLTNTTTYFVETTNINGCVSARTPVTVTVDPIPAAPQVTDVTTCPGTTAAITAGASPGTFQWYNSASGGQMLATGQTFITPVLTSGATYYVQNVVGQCVGPRAAVKVKINAIIDPQFVYPTGTSCDNAPDATPKILNPSGGTFSATPAGIIFKSAKTGEINVSASVPGTYIISFTGNDACPHTSTSTYSILSKLDAHFTYNGPYCQDQANPRPEYSYGSSGGNFTASPVGLVFVNTSTGEINLGASKPGTYSVTNTINPGGSCVLTTATTTVTISERVTVNAGLSQTVKMGTPVQLAGSITGSVSTGRWSGGTGTFSDPTSLNPIYTPGNGETTAHLTLLSDAPAAPCGAHADIVTIYFIPPPPAPTVLGTTICDGTNTTLAATAPGGTYQWFTSATSNQVLTTGATFTTLWLTKTTTYYVQTIKNGYTSARTPVTITVSPEPAAPIVTPPQTCSGGVATLQANGPAGFYEWYDAPVGGNLLATSNTYTTQPLQQNTSYYVQVRTNNCTSPRTEVDVPVSVTPNVISESSGTVCSGNALDYTIRADISTATFNWSRAAVTGISNAAVNQTSGTINEALINTTANTINVTYVITPVNGSCSGPSFNYIVTVYPQPAVTGPSTANICNYNTDNYQILFNTPLANYHWSRAVVPGVSNAAVSGQNSSVIKEVLFNTSNKPVTVPYTINYQTNTCDATPFVLNITVNPTAVVTSDTKGSICSGTAQNYVITSNIESATYSWSRAAVNNISNTAVSNKSSATIDETLINTGTSSITVTYIIVPQAYGCDGTPFIYKVTVNPAPGPPVVKSNSPVCLGSTIQLRTPSVVGASYLWTGPNGYSSTLQNPNIENATAANFGNYNLTVTTKQGCPSPGSDVAVVVNAPGVAVAGPDQKVCASINAVQLNGNITGGPATGIWTTAGTGTFSSINALDAKYFPSQADKDAGSVTLTLSSASPDNCAISTSMVIINFGPVPTVSAGPGQVVCSQETAIKLTGTLLAPVNVQWTSSGTGTFSADNQPDATYFPSAADKENGQVTLKLSILNGGPCYIASDTMVIKFDGPPKLNPGGTVYVLKGHTITLNPVVYDSNLTYLWSPNIDIDNVTAKNPVITGNVDRFYTLTVTNSLGCQTTDTTYVKVSPEIKLPNTFTPNGDGINDKWEIYGLSAYTQATVDIFNRYGQNLFHSLGYPIPWDGTYKGQPLPSGTYYYIINTKVNNQVLSGDIMIIR